MAANKRRIALVCMTPAMDTNESGMYLPSYGIHRILASVAADPELRGVQLALVDGDRPDVERYVQAIESIEPDLIGMSIYVWSTPCLVEAARRIKERRPECMIVFGGPSARTALFDLPPYAEPWNYLDAVVASEGEVTFREIARLPQLTRSALKSVGGLDLPSPAGWMHTGPRTSIARLDEIASPFQLRLMPQRSVAYLETYRGCPLSCTFCEWGASDAARTVFSADYIVREFAAFQQQQATAVFLLDAGLNLNARGFRNLRDAQARTGFLRHTNFWCEVYPSFIKEEHLEFLGSVGIGYLGVGLQSIDRAVLKSHERHFDDSRFETVVRQLAEVAHVEVQIIFGLPGDTPEGFRRTLAFARSMPATVRAYHCLVLPDALMTRGRPEWNMQFDPVTLEMISCEGWQPGAITEMRTALTYEALASGGTAGNFWWHFPRSG